MTVAEFDSITLRELYLKIDGFTEDRQQMEENRLYWLRELFAHIYNTAGKSYKGEVKPQQFFKLDFEKRKHSVIPSDKRRKEIIAMKKKWKTFKQTTTTLDEVKKLIQSKKN